MRCELNIPTTIAGEAITSLPPGNSMPTVSRSSTEGRGNDYMKAPVEERFEIKNGRASWKSRSEHGEQEVTGKAFYLPINAPPEFLGVLTRALLKAPNHKLALLPAGEARIEEAGKASVASGKGDLTQVPHHGSWLFAAIDLARPGR